MSQKVVNMGHQAVEELIGGRASDCFALIAVDSKTGLAIVSSFGSAMQITYMQSNFNLYVGRFLSGLVTPNSTLKPVPDEVP